VEGPRACNECWVLWVEDKRDDPEEGMDMLRWWYQRRPKQGDDDDGLSLGRAGKVRGKIGAQ
jgi:hypothetical protein